jgi:serine/threonine-protein kinase RIO1
MDYCDLKLDKILIDVTGSVFIIDYSEAVRESEDHFDEHCRRDVLEQCGVSQKFKMLQCPYRQKPQVAFRISHLMLLFLYKFSLRREKKSMAARSYNPEG